MAKKKPASSRLRQRFPEHFPVSLISRIFSKKNLNRILEKSTKVSRFKINKLGLKRTPPALSKASTRSEDRKMCQFLGLLEDRMQTWGKLDPDLLIKKLEIEGKEKSLFRLFQRVKICGGWRQTLGLGLWGEIEKELAVENAREMYEKYLSCIDSTIHPESTPRKDSFPARKLSKWQEVVSLQLPASDLDLQYALSLEACVFRFQNLAVSAEEITPEKLGNWAEEKLLSTPLMQTSERLKVTGTGGNLSNERNLGIPMLVYNCGIRQCSIEIVPDTLPRSLRLSMNNTSSKQFCVVQNPGDVLLVQGLIRLSLFSPQETEVLKLSVLPQGGQRLLSILEKADIGLKEEVPFPLFSIVYERMMQAKLLLARNERYLVARCLMDQVEEWEDEDVLEDSSIATCIKCKKELFLTGWKCVCRAVLCKLCKQVRLS